MELAPRNVSASVSQQPSSYKNRKFWNWNVTLLLLPIFHGKKSGAGADRRLLLIRRFKLITFLQTILWKLASFTHCRKIVRQSVINPDFNFNKMGIGGLDQEFNAIFRRAFASRVFPPEVIEQLGTQKFIILLRIDRPFFSTVIPFNFSKILFFCWESPRI